MASTSSDQGPRPRAATPASGLATLAAEADGCRACPLWQRATQVVFGEGPADARLVAVGEQPGDQEDRRGHPFVGPAGKLFDGALAEAGIDRSTVYVTNAVKHFKWKERGARRIHDKPNRREVVACHRWLDAELDVLPADAVVVSLGATAGQSLLGPSFRVSQARGAELRVGSHPLVATLHPSAVLRAGDRREDLMGQLVEDLGRARALAARR